MVIGYWLLAGATVRAHRSEPSTGLALAATEDALRASYLLFANGYWEKNCGRPVLYFGSSRCAQPLPLRLYRPCRSSHSLHSPRLRPGKHCRPLQQHSMFRQNVQNSQNRFSSKAFGLSESILLILLILSEFAPSRTHGKSGEDESRSDDGAGNAKGP